MTDAAIPDAASALQEPWPNLALQREGVGIGMWVFLMSEILFFAALFCIYAVYRGFNPQAFRLAAAHTDILYGSINTVLLLTSSLTMTIALRAATARLRQLTLACLAITAALGLAFLAVKGIEYADDISKALVPGPRFSLSPPPTELFWMLYWIMTGIHAIHLSAGVLVVTTVALLFARRVIPVQGSTMEGVAIYWHFVELGLAHPVSAALPRRTLMNGDRRDSRHLWLGPGMVWLGLLALFAVTSGSAYLPLGVFNIAVNLFIAAVMIVLLAIFLMDLRRSSALLRLLAGAGLFWSIFMFALTFTDYLSRHY